MFCNGQASIGIAVPKERACADGHVPGCLVRPEYSGVIGGQ